MPDFWFALIAIGFLVTAPNVWFHLDQPIFYSVGLHSDRAERLQPRLPPPPRPAGDRLGRSRASPRGAASTASSMLDVLNADYVRTARAKGVPQRQVIRSTRSGTR